MIVKHKLKETYSYNGAFKMFKKIDKYKLHN